ncbi:alpha-galactosidase [Occultella glacieicola]|uniref:alpha-galactosidase n=2 Tax=Occultella glacieicola TaxID=2518684 RepID=A0ABY2DYP3_9MICO|nr:alpha-galactosidase [Occultella glacieicola]
MPIEHLRRGGTSVVLNLDGGRLPRILHWGTDLGDLTSAALEAFAGAVEPTVGDSAVTYPQPVPVLPALAEGWLGRPGIVGSRGGRAFAPLFSGSRSTVEDHDGTLRVRTTATDAVSELDILVTIELGPSGLLRAAAELTNTGADAYRLDALEMALPLPSEAAEILDLTGRWALERVPQRHPLRVGSWVRESRGGKPGLDHSTMLTVGEPSLGFRKGRVWGVHLGWSGNQVLAAELVPAGTRFLRAGELLLPDEVVLTPGQTHQSPWVYGSWGEGLDELASRVHRHLRARPTHPRSPRPVVLNTWEAVYFDHDPQRLIALAEQGADLGIERFVVDDGWFLNRRDDTRGLGDWLVDPAVWPEGLDALAARVHELGMEFGLWVEPEMVNLDSDLAREHPDWVFDGGHGTGLPSRHQHGLDLTHEAAYALALERISTLVERLGIDFLKWDHNRYLTDAGHSSNGHAAVRAQTLQAYRMMAELRDLHPGLEIESCASGGGRIDLGVLEHTDRVWPSDCNDPHDRVDIQRWTGLLVPPELQGTHIGAMESHTTHRVAPLDFRAATAFWGHFGIELDLATLNPDETEAVRAWVQQHRAVRDLLHSGDVVHADTQPAVRLEGVVGADRRSALFQFVVLDRPAVWPPERLRFPGLDPDRTYRVSEFVPGASVPEGQRPPWLSAGVSLPGRVLAEAGLEAPSLDVDRSVLLRLDAAGS